GVRSPAAQVPGFLLEQPETAAEELSSRKRNRRSADELGEADCVRKRSGVRLAVVDIDGFKVLHHSLGSVAGDQLLIEGGLRLQAARARRRCRAWAAAWLKDTSSPSPLDSKAALQMLRSYGRPPQFRSPIGDAERPFSTGSRTCIDPQKTKPR